MRSAEERFWMKVQKTERCWLWIGAKSSGGYGVIRVERRLVRAHRWSYETYRGPIPEGLVIDHLCRVRNCVNPEHLEPVTHGENVRRSPIVGGYLRQTNGAKTHCCRGHLFDQENTRIDRRGWRMCRACGRVRYAEAKAAA